MKHRSILAFLFMLSLSAPSAWAATLKIMSYNTMCEICDWQNDYGPFRERLEHIADTVRRHDPDLISFQEFQSPIDVWQVRRLLNSEYVIIYERLSIYPATDTVLFIKKSRFEILSQDGVWLGPESPYFSFGWNFRAPRRFQWARIRDKATGREFIFAGSHFDNSDENKVPSAKFAVDFIKRSAVPVIFASDSNLQPGTNGYSVLRSDGIRDTFEENEKFVIFSNGEVNAEAACSDGPEPSWPNCRIDHVLMSHAAPWKVESWGVDAYRYFRNEKFSSDHRAVIVELREEP